MKKFYNKIYVIVINLFLLFSSFSFFQNFNTKKSIDSVYTQTNDDLNKYLIPLNKVIEINFKLVQESKKIDYTYGEIRSLIALGRHLNNINKYSTSLKFLNLALELNKVEKNANFSAQIYTEYAKNHDNLGSYSISLNYFNKALRIINSDKDYKKDHEYLGYVYGCKASLFQDLNKKDSLYSCLIKANKAFENPAETARIARFHLLYNNDFDSCYFYLQKAENLVASKKFMLTSRALILRIYGLSYFKSKNYDKSIYYYKKSLEISKKYNRKKEYRGTLIMLNDVYTAIGNKEEQLKLLKEYTKINGEIEHQISNALLYEMNKSLTEEKKTSSTLLYILVITTSSGLLISYLFYIFHKRKITIKKNLLSQKELETQELKQKLSATINDSFEELVEMAKENNPEFLPRFREVYPEFCDKLVQLDPKITSDTLKFCALLKLNFSTKEISDYTFVTIRAVQIRKGRLRKKLNIPSNIDLNVWMVNL